MRIYSLRYEVYCIECGYLPPESFKDGLESDEYDAHAAHFTAHNFEDDVVGTLRIVQPADSQCFPFERHCKTIFTDIAAPAREQCGEISRLVVRKSYRRRIGDSISGVAQEFVAEPAHDDAQGSGLERRSSSPQILLGLYREAYLYSLRTGIRYWYAAMERPLARVLARLDFVFTPIGVETDYYGPVTPYMADLRELEERVGAANPRLLAWLRGTAPGRRKSAPR
jgi:N-acyl amino acid synthase of PEP-CTERM/exosortase system